MDDFNNDDELLNETTANVTEPVEQAEPVTEAVETSEPKTLRDAVLKAFEKTTGEKEPTNALPQAAEPAKVEPAKEIDPISGRELEPIRAPSSMTPLLRDKWGTVPREMQKFWVDRERDMQVRLQETADERKIAKQFGEVAAPYEATFRQFNTNAVAHAKELFNLDHQLRTGSPAQKAQIIHSLISHFQPDVQTLVQLANGRQGQAAPAQQAPDVQAVVRQELAAREEKQREAEVQRHVDAFTTDPKNEFIDDLRPLMQKAIEAGFVEGKDIPELFRNAYDFAAQQHPEVKQILASRAAATQSQVQPQPTTQTAKPIQSVKPSLASGGRGGQTQPRPKSLREAAEMAWNKHSHD
jgi:flagellar hook-basal body complex protein FliE